MAAGLTKDTDGLGAVGAYKALANYTQLGGVLTVFACPSDRRLTPQEVRGRHPATRGAGLFLGATANGVHETAA